MTHHKTPQRTRTAARWHAHAGIPAMTLLLIGATTGHAHAAGTLRQLSLSGQSGSSFIVTVGSAWQLDFGKMRTTGGDRYQGVALELLGRPANDGLSTSAARFPDSERGPAGRGVHALGDVGRDGLSGRMPPGRYLLIILGDRSVHLTIPLVGSTTPTSVRPTTRHSVRFLAAAAAITRRPGLPGLYGGAVTLRLPLANDPLVLTQSVTTSAAGPHTQDHTDCLRRSSGACDAESDASFGTGNATTSAQTTHADAYYDTFDGLTAHSMRYARSAMRGSAASSTLFTSALIINGANR